MSTTMVLLVVSAVTGCAGTVRPWVTQVRGREVLRADLDCDGAVRQYNRLFLERTVQETAVQTPGSQHQYVSGESLENWPYTRGDFLEIERDSGYDVSLLTYFDDTLRDGLVKLVEACPSGIEVIKSRDVENFVQHSRSVPVAPLLSTIDLHPFLSVRATHPDTVVGGDVEIYGNTDKRWNQKAQLDTVWETNRNCKTLFAWTGTVNGRFSTTDGTWPTIETGCPSYWTCRQEKGSLNACADTHAACLRKVFGGTLGMLPEIFVPTRRSWVLQDDRRRRETAPEVYSSIYGDQIGLNAVQENLLNMSFPAGGIVTTSGLNIAMVSAAQICFKNQFVVPEAKWIRIVTDGFQQAAWKLQASAP